MFTHQLSRRIFSSRLRSLGAIAAAALTAAPVHADGFSGFGPAQSYGAGYDPAYVAMADLNNNGHNDLVFAHANDVFISVMLNNGDGTFGPRANYAVDYGQRGLAIGDFDGDGNLDIAVGATENFHFNVLLGVGDGTFAPRTNIPNGFATTWGVAAGDLDGDGVLDIVVTHPFSDSLSMHLGDGEGGFAAPITLQTGSRPRQVALSDVSGNGALDIVVVQSNSHTMSVFFNDRRANFGPRQDYNTGNAPRAVAVADMNGDGSLDIVVAGYSGVDVFLNNGDGTFAPRQNYSAGTGLESVAIGDLDGDGVLDVVVAVRPSHSVNVLLGVGDGTLAPALSYDAGMYASAVAIGDLDGDGGPDIAVANDGVNMMIVRFNLTFGPAPGAFALLAPGDGVVGLPLPETNNWFNTPAALSWSAPPLTFHDPQYSVVIATDPGLMNIVVEAHELTDTSFPIPVGMLSPNTTYYWGVVASNPGGDTLSTPATAVFRTANPGDLTVSGTVNAQDLATLLSWWGQ